MRLPLGKPILANFDSQNQTLFQLLRAFYISGFHGYVAQRKDGGSAVILLEDGNPIHTIIRKNGKETLMGPAAAQEFASKLEYDDCKIAKLSENSLKIALIICKGNNYATGLAPNSKVVGAFYKEYLSKKLNGLIQLYNDFEEYYIWIEEGRLVEKHSVEELNSFRSKGGVQVDLYTYYDDQLVPQALTLDLFISPFWFRNFLLKQLKRNFHNKIDSLKAELQTSIVELKFFEVRKA